MEQYRKLTDEELLDRFYAQHDAESLGHLLQRYTLMLLGVSMKYLKDEEAARETMCNRFF